MPFLIKVNYGTSLRRFSLKEEKAEDLRFAVVENKIRKIFDISAKTEICVTYNDDGNDVVTMAEDDDLVDALVMQSLNPLRLHVSLSESEDTFAAVESKGTPLAAALATSAEVNRAMFDIRRVETSTSKRDIKAPRALSPKALPFEPTRVAGFTLPKAGVDKKGSADSTVPEVGEPTKDSVGSAKASTSQVSAEASTSQGSAADKPVEEVRKPIGNGMTVSPFESYWSGNHPSVPAFSSVVSRPRRPGELASPPSFVAADAGDSKTSTRVVHTRVHCDGCGMVPIVGARFKSNTIGDYDLCLNCFDIAGNQADFTRIDRPLYRPRHLHPSSGRVRCPAMDASSSYNQWKHTSLPPYCGRPVDRWGHVSPMHGSAYGGKLDSRFVEDVTIMDGSEMAPSTHFTKIWRLRNSGRSTWPPKTKLVHVGGDELGSVFNIPLKLPEHGLLPDQEVEAAVDLVAPEKPGRYVSHWRLASPAGPKFGHRVWVVINVVTKENRPNPLGLEVHVNDTDKCQQENAEDVALITPAKQTSESREAFVKASHDAIQHPVVKREAFVKASHEAFEEASGKKSFPEKTSVSSFLGEAEPFSGLKICDTEEVADAKDESSLVGEDKKSGTESDVPLEKMTAENEATLENVLTEKDMAELEIPTENDVESDEIVAVESSELGGGFSMVEMPSNGSSPDNSSSSTPRDSGVIGTPSPIALNAVERPDVMPEDKEVGVQVGDVPSPKFLARKLVEMGFTDEAVNKERLEKNQMDLDATVADLLTLAKWQPMLNELEEMGFIDNEYNRSLMLQYDGSVKRVVKHLVNLYRN